MKKFVRFDAWFKMRNVYNFFLKKAIAAVDVVLLFFLITSQGSVPCRQNPKDRVFEMFSH